MKRIRDTEVGPGPGRASEIVPDKVFDTDGNPVSAGLRVWGPEEVDGELCIVVEPTDFHPDTCEPNEHYDGRRTPIISADDLRVAVPVRLCGADDQLEAVVDSIAAGLPKKGRWADAAPFMEHVARVPAKAGFERPDHRPEG